MSSDYTAKDMTGAIFKNPYKTEGDSKPQMTGHGTINGRKVKISAWTKDGKNGRFQSIKFTWADEAPTTKKPEPASSQLNDPLNDMPWDD